jgi:hypothetical protein
MKFVLAALFRYRLTAVCSQASILTHRTSTADSDLGRPLTPPAGGSLICRIANTGSQEVELSSSIYDYAGPEPWSRRQRRAGFAVGVSKSGSLFGSPFPQAGRAAGQ